MVKFCLATPVYSNSGSLTHIKTKSQSYNIVAPNNGNTPMFYEGETCFIQIGTMLQTEYPTNFLLEKTDRLWKGLYKVKAVYNC